jgi:MFS family permease
VHFVTDATATARQTTGLTKHPTRRTLSSLNWSLGLRSVFGTVSGSSSFVFVGFALQMGIAKEQMGWIASMVSAACVMQMAGLLVSSRVKNKKRMVVRLSLAEPILLILAVATVPFLPPGWRLYGLAIATFASAALLNMTRPLADDWTASAIPAGLRENFLGRRSQVMSIIAIAATLASGYAADGVTRWGSIGLAVILIIGALFGVFAALPLRRAVLPSVTARANVSWADLKDVAANREFRRYMIVIILISLPFCFASPYYQVFHLQVLGLKPTSIAYLTIGYLIFKVLLSRLSANWVSRLGADHMLSLVGLIYTIFFFTYVATASGHVWPVFVGWMLTGMGDAIFNVAQGTALFAVVPHTPARSAYFAVFNLLILALYGAGGLLAMPILEWFKHRPVAFGPWTLDNFHCLYALVLIMMVLCTGAVRLIHLNPDTGTSDTR